VNTANTISKAMKEDIKSIGEYLAGDINNHLNKEQPDSVHLFKQLERLKVFAESAANLKAAGLI
jgi:hypothetical protein